MTHLTTYSRLDSNGAEGPCTLLFTVMYSLCTVLQRAHVYVRAALDYGGARCPSAFTYGMINVMFILWCIFVSESFHL